MKKGVAWVLSCVVLIFLATGVYLVHKTSTPEYTLAKTIEDVRTMGINGLKDHLTDDAAEKLEIVEDWTGRFSGSEIIKTLSQESAVSFLKSKMSDVNWTVEDVLKGKEKSVVVVGFDYSSKITGTIGITMVREGWSWKIDGFEYPHFDKLSLW